MWPFTSPAPPAPAPSADGCPVDHSTRSAWLAASTSSTSSPPPSHPTQPLSTLSLDREISSIPRWLPPTPSPAPEDPPACPARSAPSNSATSDAPPAKSENWVYPSPSSFYTALQRKNREPQAKDMPIVVPIHNAVNERVWEQVLEWERVDGGAEGSKLVSFVGKPKELSPRARWKTLVG